MLGWATLWSWFWDRVVAWLVSLSAFLLCDYSGELSNTACPHPHPCSPNVANSKEQGQFTCSHTLGFYLPALVLWGPALLFCPGEMQGLLSELLHFGRVGPILLRLPLAPAAGGRGGGGGECISLTLATPGYSREEAEATLLLWCP